ncbi:retrovirus-related pol polyprotein from transposon TNT 1-94 [Tanacetum coccineum]
MPPSLSAYEEDNDLEQTQRDKDMQKNIALIAKYYTKIYKPTKNNLRTSLNSRNKNADSTPRTGNDRQIGQKQKRVKEYSYHKEKMMLCKPEEKGVHLSVEQSEWLQDTNEDPNEQELEAHYIQYSEQPKSINDTYAMEKVDSNVIPDHSDMCNNEFEDDQNADDNDEDERVELANLIANLKLDINENKKIKKQLRKANVTLTYELNESKSTLTESNDIRDRCRSVHHQKVVELEKYITYINCQLKKEEIERKYKETLDLLAQQKHQSHEALKSQAYETFQFKEKNVELVHQGSLENIRYDLLRKEKEQLQKDFKIKILRRSLLWKIKASFVNPMYIKKAQSEKPCLYKVPYDKDDLVNIFSLNCDETLILEQESRSKMDKDLLKPYDYTYQNSLYELFTPQTQKSLDQLYFAMKLRKKLWRKSSVKHKPNIVKNIGFLPNQYSMCKSRKAFHIVKHNITNFQTIVEMDKPITHEITVLVKDLLMPLVENTIVNASESERILKKEMFDDLQYVQSFEKELDELQSDKNEFLNGYDLLLQECLSKDILCVALSSMTDIDEYSEMACKYLEKVKECECLETKFSKQKGTVSNEDYHKLVKSFCPLQQHSISVELALQQYLKAQLQDKDIAISELKKLIEKSKGKSMETKFDKPLVVRQTNVIKVPKPSVLGVIHNTSVSMPQLRSNQMKDKVVQNNSQVKIKQKEVEDHHRISSISNKTKSVIACNDSLKSRTLNINVVCATFGKCVFNSIHNACVSKFLNNVNARSKKPQVVPIRPRKPIRKTNQSIATPPKKIVASDPTIYKSKSYYKMLYEKTSLGMDMHMTENLKLLCNFVEKYLGTIRFDNDQISPILGYGDLVQGNITIKRVYYVEGLNHNLFFIGQFCDADMEVVFRKSTCYIRNLQGNDLLTGTHISNLYTIALQESSSPSLICFREKASLTQAWLWHHRLSHLNFNTINMLLKNDIVKGLPKLKFIKD